jgi:ectoine hydroxylase
MKEQYMDIEEDFKKFWADGYLIIPKMFSKQEMQILKDVIMANDLMNRQTKNIEQKMSQGKRPSFETIFVWNDTSGNDIFAKATRRSDIFNRLEYFFKDKIYVYHNKIALKYPGVVGFRYHQDYAYWYGMGNLYPNMATVLIAIDSTRKENGCLKILTGSHLMGRIDHVHYDGISDSGVSPDRLEVIQQRLPEVFVELDSGDIVMFHCNTLHGSDDNKSADSRIALLGCYNTKGNNPYETACGHPLYQHQERIDEKITEHDSLHLPDFELNYS